VTLTDRPPTQRDVALVAGVSTATVSYVLSGRRDRREPVLPETRDRVLQAARELGYERNHAARSLRRRNTEFVAVVFRSPSNPWVERLSSQLHDRATAHGFSMIALPIEREVHARSALRVLRERYVDGAVVTSDCGLATEDLEALAARGFRLVIFDDDLEPRGFDVLRQHKREACTDALEHLVDRGHRRIAYFGHGGLGDDAEEDVTYRTYREVLDRHGIPLDPSLVSGSADSRTQAYRATQALVRRPDPPTALFSASDRAAIAAISAARDANRDVPRDLAVIGVGNTDEGEILSPSLTSVGIPEFDFRPTVDRLFARIRGDATDDGVTLDARWRLFVRSST
jgi:DNA-binding LacI/PurR family transcriptional regulator